LGQYEKWDIYSGTFVSLMFKSLIKNDSMFGAFPCFGSGIPEKERVATGAARFLAEMYEAVATFNF